MVEFLPTTVGGYLNNTMSKNDILVDALIVHGARNGPLSYRPKSIREYVKEISTMFHGRCFMIEKRFEVT